MFRDQLSKCTTNSLNHIAILCGFHIPSKCTKAGRIDSIVSGLQFINQLPSKVNILLIDIGIKNFSYCRTEAVDLHAHPLHQHRISEWSKLNLDHVFGTNYSPVISPDHPLDKRRYLNYITQLITDTCVGKNEPPTLVIFEAQRTSNAGGGGRSGMLPTVLLNYTFENILYTNFYLRYPQTSVWPLSATRMASLWINRYFDKASMKLLRKNSKTFRLRLLFYWLIEDVLFKSAALSKNDSFVGMKETEIARKLILSLKLSDDEMVNRLKIDDLVDSLLYNLTAIQYLKNLHLLKQALENGHDLKEFVHKQNSRHILLLKPLTKEYDLILSEEFAEHA